MNSSRLNRLVLCSLGLLLLLSPLQAQTTLKKILKNGEIRIGVSGNQPPFSMRAKDGGLIGYEVELAGLLAEAMGVTLRLEMVPFPQLLSDLKKGKIDGIMSGMTITPQRNLEVAFIGPYLTSGKSILTKSATLALANSAEELNQDTLKLATLKGSTSEKFAASKLDKTSLTLVNSYNDALKMLMDGQIHALVADYPYCAITQITYPDQGFQTLSSPLTLEPIGMAIPANDPLYLNLVENYLTTLEAEGILEELEQNWFLEDDWLIKTEQ